MQTKKIPESAMPENVKAVHGTILKLAKSVMLAGEKRNARFFEITAEILAARGPAEAWKYMFDCKFHNSLPSGYKNTVLNLLSELQKSAEFIQTDLLQ